MKKIFPSISFTFERWKWNENYQIFVSNQGRIKNKNKQLLPIKVKNGTGYLVIQLENGLFKAVHRIVLETWKPIINMEDFTVDHHNHNKRDNRLCNLEWMTREDNLFLAQQDLIEDNDIEKNQLNSINFLNPIIVCGKKMFKSYNEIIDFLIEEKKITNDNVIKKNIKNNIIKAIKNNHKYCNYYFELR